MRPVISFVVPIFDEHVVIPLLLRRMDELLASLAEPAEVLFIDDGSRDASPIVLRAKAKDDPRYRYVRLSRNFGHQIAITTGLDLARGDAVIVMDADLQDPPELVEKLIGKWREGYDVVAAQRLSREGESRFKKATAGLFYRLLSRLASVEIPRDVGDFRLIDRSALDAFLALRERERFVRGMMAWVGFRQTTVPFHRPPRAGGTTKYPLAKMVRLAVNALISFSEAPLRLALWTGMGVSVLAMIYGLYVVGLWFSDAQLAPGWSSIIVVVAFLGGANMMMTGIMGLYVGRIYSEVKGRPLYLIDERMSINAHLEAPRQETASRRRA